MAPSPGLQRQPLSGHFILARRAKPERIEENAAVVPGFNDVLWVQAFEQAALRPGWRRHPECGSLATLFSQLRCLVAVPLCGRLTEFVPAILTASIALELVPQMVASPTVQTSFQPLEKGSVLQIRLQAEFSKRAERISIRTRVWGFPESVR